MMKLKNSLIKLKKWKRMQTEKKLIYETNEYACSFKNFQTRKIFGRNICEGKITIEEADKYQTDLLAEVMNFMKNMKLRSQEKKQEKEIVLENLHNFFEGKEKILDAFEAKYFRQNLRVQAF